MSDIQKARVVLAKWREEARSGRWHFSFVNDGIVTIDGDMERSEFEIASPVSKQDGRLIVGTAGNPDLWDEQDAMFARAIELADISGSEPLVVFAKRIAAVILSADERMSA